MSLDYINNLTAPQIIEPTLSITTAPHGASFNFPILGHTYSDPTTYYTPIGVPITFAGAATFYTTFDIAVDWQWDFGDGSSDTGQTVTHTYKAAFPDCPVILRVTDSNGNIWGMRQQVYLQNISLSLIQRGLPVPLSITSRIRSTSNSVYLENQPIQPAVSTNRIPAL